MSTIALGGALAFVITGGITTFFAPCAYPLLGGYVGYLLDDTSHDYAVLPAVVAAAGTLVALVGIGGVGMVLGQTVLARLTWFEPLVGLVMVGVGVLQLTGLGPSVSIELPKRSVSLGGFAVFGMGYGVAAAGCVLPVLIGVISQAVAVGPTTGLVLIGAYAGAVAVPLLGVTLLVSAGLDYWQQAGRYTSRLQDVAGVAMILAGIGQLVVSLWVFDLL